MSIGRYWSLHLFYANGLSTSIFNISVFPQPIDVLKMLSRFSPSNKEGRDRRKNNKSSKLMSSFFTNGKTQPSLTCTQKIKRIKIVIIAMTRDNVLACTKPKSRYINAQLHILKKHLSRFAAVLCKFFMLIFQENKEKRRQKL